MSAGVAPEKLLALVSVALAALCVASAPLQAQPSGSARRIALAAEEQVGKTTLYDPRYVRLAFPMGDLPIERGVCADVVIRALRAIGLDLQAEVHRDMLANFAAYPPLWRSSEPDASIDHRRVPNLERFFERRGLGLRPSSEPTDYQPGDIVAWRLDNGLPHIGIVSTRGAEHGRPMMVHNIGAGSQLEDVLFHWRMTGHYRLPDAVAP